MIRTGVITDELWELIEPVLPSDVGRRGRRWRDHWQVLEAIGWRFRTGAPRRDVPAESGPWQPLWKRHRRWSGDGTYQAIFEHLLAGQETRASWTGWCRRIRPSCGRISIWRVRPPRAAPGGE